MKSETADFFDYAVLIAANSLWTGYMELIAVSSVEAAG
jgi:hypothetical protein